MRMGNEWLQVSNPVLEVEYPSGVIGYEVTIAFLSLSLDKQTFSAHQHRMDFKVLGWLGVQQ